MKLLHPEVSPNLVELESDTDLFYSDDKIIDHKIQYAAISGQRLKSTSIEESLVYKIDFSHTIIEKFETKDCIYDDCNFTMSAFSDSSWHAVQIVNSRCSGVQFQSSVLKNVVFKGCKIELANFRFANLENVIFEDCMIDDIDFYNASLKNVQFSGSSIENIAFSGARLKDIDLSDAHILSVKNVTGLKGATISYEQLIFLAPYFTQELGILIKN